ncbi:Aquaporin-1 [Armadillidium vulgare]|nr:Aquaporin-1 [Armadillidium vulgare]
MLYLIIYVNNAVYTASIANSEKQLSRLVFAIVTVLMNIALQGDLTTMKPTVEEGEEEGGEEKAGPKDEVERTPTPPSCRGVSIEVPAITIPMTGTQSQPLQETPVAALRRYLDTIPQHPSAKTELRVELFGVASEFYFIFVKFSMTEHHIIEYYYSQCYSLNFQGMDTLLSNITNLNIKAIKLTKELFSSVSIPAKSSFLSLWSHILKPKIAFLNHPRTLSSSTKDFYISETDSQDAMGFGWGAEWAIGHGLTLGALTWAIRSAHFSLPTTLALFVSRKISVLRAGLHTLAQIIGALIATPVLLGLLPRPPRAPSLALSLSPAQGWGAEFLATVLVTLISLSSYESAFSISRLNNQPRHSLGFTGVGLNPARSLALAALTGNWAHHWIYSVEKFSTIIIRLAGLPYQSSPFLFYPFIYSLQFSYKSDYTFKLQLFFL